jgi:hypothetical protein
MYLVTLIAIDKFFSFSATGHAFSPVSCNHALQSYSGEIADRATFSNATSRATRLAVECTR